MGGGSGGSIAGPVAWRRALLLCLIAGAVLLAPAGAARGAMYWGATISGETYGQSESAPANKAAWELFERHAGKRVAVLNMGMGWGKFDSARLEAARSRDVIPMVTTGLAAGVTLADVASGGQDTVIRSWAKAAKAWGHPFFLAPWWEMNGDWYAWGRDPNFVAAWRHFHDLVVAEGATNVTWTWVPNSIWADPESDPRPYYPGDAYVDWAGLDSYNWGRNPAQPDRWIDPDQTITPTLDLIEEVAPTKPLILVETASSEFGGNKTEWIRELLTAYLPHHPEIKAFLWFNWPFPKGEQRADWPIESSAPAQQEFRKGIQSSLYRSQAPAMAALTKVPPPPEPAGPESPAALDLSPAGEVVGGPQVAAGPDGTATVVWSARDGADFTIYSRRIAADGVPEPGVTTLSDPAQDALSPDVAVAPDGTATVTWIRWDGANFVVEARRIAPDGTPAAATIAITGPGQNAAAPQVAVAADGTSMVVWKRFDGFHYLVQERPIAPDGSRGERGILSLAKQDAVEPQVAYAADGTATVVWSRFDGSDSIVQMRRVAPDGIPGEAISDLSASGESAIQPQIDLAPDGTATVLWNRFDGSNWVIESRRIAADGSVDAATGNLSASGRDAAEPELAVGPEGVATAVWERWDGTSFVIQARRIDAAGGLQPSAANLSAAGRDAAEPDVAVAPDGAATVIWSRFDGAAFVVQQRGIAADGTPAPSSQDLSEAGPAGDPAVAPAADGSVTSVWKRADGAGDAVQASTMIPPPPPPPPSTASSPTAEVKLDGTPVDNSFRIGRPLLNRRKGFAKLPVTVPGPGSISLSGARPTGRAAAGAGTVMLPVRAGGAKLKALLRRNAVKLKLTVTFVPEGGAAASQRATVRLVKRP
jgi:hypothetical protein